MNLLQEVLAPVEQEASKTGQHSRLSLGGPVEGLEWLGGRLQDCWHGVDSAL